MLVTDLGTLDYRAAWEAQERVHAEVVAGGQERLLLVEHPPVITLGRRPGGERNLLAAPERLAELGVQLVSSDRGGDVTFHGLGQIVAYPIVRLNDHRLSVGAYVHGLEDAVIDALSQWGIRGQKDTCAVGVWVDDGTASPAKVCAIGVRIRRGVSLHGLALNVSTDLRYFDLIVPCGLTCRAITSVQKLLGPAAPSIEAVREGLAEALVRSFSGR